LLILLKAGFEKKYEKYFSQIWKNDFL